MRRFRIVFFTLAASMILSVLVAWARVLWSPYTRHTEPPEARIADGYPARIAGPRGIQAWWYASYGFGVMQAVPLGAHGVEGQFTYWKGSHTPAFYRGGWPMLAMQSVVTFQEDDSGRYFDWPGIALMPTFHPAYLLRNPAGKREVWEDMKAVLKRLGKPVPRRGGG